MKNLLYINLLFVIFSCTTEAQKTAIDYAEGITEAELKTHSIPMHLMNLWVVKLALKGNLSDQLFKRLL